MKRFSPGSPMESALSSASVIDSDGTPGEFAPLLELVGRLNSSFGASINQAAQKLEKLDQVAKKASGDSDKH